MPTDMLSLTALGCAALSAALLVWYLAWRPALTRATKIVLLFGIGLLPLGAAMTGNYAGFEATTERRFCGSCHVMSPYMRDSEDPASTSLAARHARNAFFGDRNCYTCHADYGMFGTIKTKAGGMGHVYQWVFHYHQLPPDVAQARIHIKAPFPNATCMRCHSTEDPDWNAVEDHASILDRVRSGEVSCASYGCHGPAHPFSKHLARHEAGAR